MHASSRPILVILALLGLGASAAALYVHYQSLVDPAYTSFCDVNATVSCQSVLSSAYGRVWGIPVAAGGAIWSALVLLLAGWGMRAGAGAEAGRRAAAYVFVLAVIGLAAVFYYAYVSFFVLKQACPLCLTMDAAVILIFIVSARVAGPLREIPRRIGSDLGGLVRNPTAATLALVWVAASVALVVFFPREQAVGASPAEMAQQATPMETLAPDQLAEWHRWLDTQPRVAAMEPTGAVKVRVVKFNDYQCPACRQTWAEYASIIGRYEQLYPGQFTFEYKDFPLESECGFGGIHASACEAAAAVRMAEQKHLGKAMGAWLYEHQDRLTPDLVKQGLKEVAGITDFDARYAKVLPAIRADAQLGNSLKIKGTPTFFINGIMTPSLRPAYFDAALAWEMQKAKGAAQPGARGPARP